METIIATSFGRVVNIQGGEHDELTKAADLIFRGAEEGSKTSLTRLVALFSKCNKHLHVRRGVLGGTYSLDVAL